MMLKNVSLYLGNSYAFGSEASAVFCPFCWLIAFRTVKYRDALYILDPCVVSEI